MQWVEMGLQESAVTSARSRDPDGSLSARFVTSVLSPSAQAVRLAPVSSRCSGGAFGWPVHPNQPGQARAGVAALGRDGET